MFSIWSGCCKHANIKNPIHLNSERDFAYLAYIQFTIIPEPPQVAFQLVQAHRAGQVRVFPMLCSSSGST